MSKSYRSILTVLSFVVMLSMLVACAPAAAPAPAAEAPAAAAPAAAAPAAAAPAAAGSKVKIGLSFSDYQTARWKIEADLMSKALQDKGYETMVTEANHDPKLQNDQIDNMVAQGAKGIIVVAEDADAAATSVNKAVDAGVKVISYDRLIHSTKVIYMTFDNTLVGVNEADGVVKALGLNDPKQTKWTKENPAKIFMLGGNPNDNNAHLVRDGQMSVVKQYFDSGVAKQVGDQWVENWDPAKALDIMANGLTANQNKIDAVIASNDGTAGGAIQALQAQKMTIPISGQDADADACNRIVKGTQTVTVFKDVRVLAAKAVDAMDALVSGKTVEGMKAMDYKALTAKDTPKGDIQVLFLDVVQVTKDNVYDVVVKSGFQKYDDVYRDIPDAQKPPKPGEAAAAAPAAAGGKVKIGLSFSDYQTARWKIEADLMSKALQDKGYETMVTEANHDPKLQNDQIDNMVAQGAKGIIVVAEDADAAATAVNKAVDAGVKVLSYDRLIHSTKVVYMTFDNTLVGVNEADGVIKALGLNDPKQTKWTKENPAKIFMMGGNPNDNNAHLVRDGQMSVVKQYFDSGVAKQVGDQWVENWDPAKALDIMANGLTANQNKIDAVIASNDGTAGGAIQALQAQKMTIPISGQDADADACNRIVKGTQTVTVFKDVRVLAAKAVDAMDALVSGKTVDGLKAMDYKALTAKDTPKGDIQVLFLDVVQVTKDNVYDVVVKSGFQKYDDVYRDIPEAQRPPKP